MDAFNLLKADHQKVAQLFDQLESSNGKAKLRVFEQIRTELELHTHIEEKIFYPAVEKPKETHDLTLEAYEEHDVVKNLLRQLSKAKSANEEWEAQAKVLRENVEHHVEEEENELFPKAESALGEDKIEALGEQMVAEKERKQGRTATKFAAKKSSGAKKSASKTKSASTVAKRARASKTSGSKGTSKSPKSAKGSRSKKSAKKR